MADYISAGVNIAQGNKFVDLIKARLSRVPRPAGLLQDVGGFAALYELPVGYEKPVIVSSTDGVGTKIKLAATAGKMYYIGIDLVAMCVNDVICCGADPLFFLDYYATDKLTTDLIREQAFVSGVIDGCEEANMSLVGGETAEMPGVYSNAFDVAGFCVGIVDKDKIITHQRTPIVHGDVVIGLESSGPHANGFSLIRKVITERFGDSFMNEISLWQVDYDRSFLEAIMAPTKIYAKTVKLLKSNFEIKGIAHITGGGLIENIPRILPEGMMVTLHKNNWRMPSVFEYIQEWGNIAEHEMYRVFNCGIGMVLIVSDIDADYVVDMVEGGAAKIIGTVCKMPSPQVVTID